MFAFLKKLFGKGETATTADASGPAVENDDIIARVQGDLGADSSDSMTGESHQPVSMEADGETEGGEETKVGY